MPDINVTTSDGTITVVVGGGIGPQGPAGPPGQDGTGGGGSGQATVAIEQQVASDHWVITHSWPGGYPSVTVVDTSGNVVEGDYQYTSATQIDLFFSLPFSGTVYLN